MFAISNTSINYNYRDDSFVLVNLVLQLQLNPDNSNPRQLELPANSKQNWFPLDLPHIFAVILTPITRSRFVNRFFNKF